MIEDTRKPGAVPTALLQELSTGACRTVDQLISDLGVKRSQVKNAALVLMRRNYLMRMGAGCLQLTELGVSAAASGEVISAGPAGPLKQIRHRRETFRQRAWMSMRIRRRFSIGDISSDAETAESVEPYKAVSKIIRQLKKAGYVSEVPNRKRGTRVFILTKDTGPRVPAYREELQVLHDFNTKKDVPCPMR
jgi:hypothetical protein